MRICQFRNCTKEVPSTRRKGSVYCSVFCSQSENDRRSKERKREKRPLKICAFCRIKEVPEEKNSRCKYCSDDCNRSAINARINDHKRAKKVKVKIVKVAKEKVVKKENGINPYYLQRNT